MTTIQFDDIAALEAAVTDEFGPWGNELEITQEMINGFAELTGDRQWIHIDVERARKESPFGGPIAHGFLTLSLLPRLTGSSIGVSGHSSATNYGAESLRFLSPVPSGARIHARTRLAAVEQRAKGTLITMEIDIRVVGAEKPALLYRMQLLYR